MISTQSTDSRNPENPTKEKLQSGWCNGVRRPIWFGGRFLRETDRRFVEIDEGRRMVEGSSWAENGAEETKVVPQDE